MSINIAGTVTIVAPSAVDGIGGTAILNDTAATDFVGYLVKPGGFGGPGVRVSKDAKSEAHGSTFGTFWHDDHSFTLDVEIARSTTNALSDARWNKFCRATNAVNADGTITWTDSDGITKRVLFRREAPPTDPDETTSRSVVGLTSSDPRIYSNSALASANPITNAGNVGSPPTFTLTPTGGNVVITHTASGSAVTLLVGSPYLATGTACTVDFGARTVVQSGSYVQGAISFPGSTWWDVLPGSNAWSVTNASSVSISVRSAWINA
jgi:hypothetical protein